MIINPVNPYTFVASFVSPFEESVLLAKVSGGRGAAGAVYLWHNEQRLVHGRTLCWPLLRDTRLD